MIGRGHRGRVDRNQPEIVKALRQAGCSVQSLAKVGDGCPDLLVARGDRMWLLELKDGLKPASGRALTDREIAWQAKWPVEVPTVTSVADALMVIGLITPAIAQAMSEATPEDIRRLLKLRGVREAAGN